MIHPGDGRVFIAYDPQDAGEAQALSDRLEQAGFPVWLAGRDTAPGSPEQAYATVRSAASGSACLLLVLSGRPVDLDMLGDLTQRADAAGKPVFPVRVAPEAQVPGFPALARAKAWIDASGPAAEQGYATLVAELRALAPSRSAPQQAPVPPVAAAQPYPANPPPHYSAPPAAAPAPAHGYADWSSVEVQPGETPLGTWLLAVRDNGPDVTGSLTITDRRILFKPRVAGASLLGMLLSQRRSFKDRYTIVLGRDRVVRVQSEKHVISTWIYVTTADGAVCAFNRGLMSADPILAALQRR